MALEGKPDQTLARLTPPRRSRPPVLPAEEMQPPVVASSLSGLTAGDAVSLRASAALKRAQIEPGCSPLKREQLYAEAEGLDALAIRLDNVAMDEVLGLRKGNGGELSPVPQDNMNLAMRDVTTTVQARPDLLAAEGTMERLTLAREAGSLTLGVDAAESIGAEGAVEQMLIHQIAAVHRLGMRLAAVADAGLDAHGRGRIKQSSGGGVTDAVRSATAAARLMDSVGRAALALDRLRNGGRQHVIVQRLVVADGGQAVVAANVGQGSETRSVLRKRGGGS